MVGERISSARKSMLGRFGVKITQEDAAHMLGVSISTYRSWELRIQRTCNVRASSQDFQRFTGMFHDIGNFTVNG